jgi:uncharacterized protein (DUF1684 family)
MSYRAEIERWRTRRLAHLTAPTGWLSLVGLDWLHQGTNVIGADPSSDVRLPAGTATPRLGVIEAGEEGVTAHLEPAAGVTHDGKPVTTLALRDDAHGSPTVLELGALSFHLIRRAGRLGIRVRDRDRPRSVAFDGIEYFPIDRKWRRPGRFSPSDPPQEVLVPNVLGFEETMVVPGSLQFEIDGTPQRLLAFEEEGTEDLFIVFGDETNGDQTYQAGRYLYARPADDRGHTILDFNKAYNPPCVFTPHATCVLPLPENRLPVRIEAGEKRYRG